MRAVSGRYLRTLRGSHTAVFRAKVCTTYQEGVTPEYAALLDVVSGEVSQSASQDIRTSLSMVTSTKWPLSADDLLAPYGNEIFVERGVQYGNGQAEWVGLGYFRINTPEQEIVPDGPVSITASDRWAGIQDAEFLRPRQFAATISRRQLTELLVREVYSGATVLWDDPVVADAAIGRQLVVETDRAGTLKELFAAVGKKGYFRYDGVFTVVTPPDATGAAVWTIDAGSNGVLVALSRNLSREGVYNVVVATGEGADTNTPAYGTAADYGENSPTRYGGRFGIVPKRISSPLILTDAQAVTAATTELKKSLGLPYQVKLTSVPNSALEVDDVIAVAYPDRARSRSMRIEKHVVDNTRIPLGAGAGPLQLDTRQQPVILIGQVAF